MNLRRQQLKNLIHGLLGDDQVDLFRLSLNSLSDRIAYAEYHLGEAKRLMLPYITGSGPRPGDPLEPFRTDITHTAAHVLACLQSLHACADICGHFVYFGLGSNLEPKPMKEPAVSAKTVLARIPRNLVAEALRDMVEHPEFEYLDAVVNRSKHRTVIYTGYTFETKESVEHQPWHGVVLWRFERLGVSYPIRRAEEFLASELDRQRAALDKVATALEKHLQADWDEQKRVRLASGERWPPRQLPDPDDEV